jgi:hypothetical protein
MNARQEIERYAAIYCMLTVANQAMSENEKIITNLKKNTHGNSRIHL